MTYPKFKLYAIVSLGYIGCMGMRMFVCVSVGNMRKKVWGRTISENI